MSIPTRQSQLEASIAAFRTRLLALDGAALAAIEQAYSPGQESILQLIDLLVSDIEAAGTISASEAARLARATELLRLIEAETMRLAQAAGQVIPQAQQQAISQALQRAESLTVAQAPDAQAAAELARQWTGLNRGALENLVGALSDGSPLNDWLRDVAGQTVDEARRVLMDGITRGVNPRDIGRNLARVSGMPLHRAQTAARSSMMTSYRAASFESFMQNQSVLKAEWEWSAALDGRGRTCAACVALSGRRFELTTAFMPSHPNCLTGNVRIQAAGVKAVSQRWYSGRLIEIETMRGHRLTVTPNHPLLTPGGWVAAGLLHEGDDLISSDGAQWALDGVNDHDEQMPPRIEEIAGALRVTPGVFPVEVPSATPHFHGDGMDGEIDVVLTDRELGNRLQTALAQQFGEIHFVIARREAHALPGLSQFDQRFLGNDSTTRRFVRGSQEGGAFIGGHLAQAEMHAGTSVAWRHTCGQEPKPDRRARYAEMRGSRLLGIASEVVSDDRVIIDAGVGALGGTDLLTRQLIPFSLGAEQAAVNEGFFEATVTEAANGNANVLHAFPGNVAPDRIVKFVVRAFSGHVFNLETKDGYYFANGIITHNCRCSPLPVLQDEDDLPGIETGQQWFDRQPRAVQEQFFPVGLRDDFRAGRIGLQDMVSLHRDETWGDSYRVSTITEARRNAARR